MNDEFIRIFAEDDTVGKEGGRPSVKKQAPWKVAIIDDEADVHQVTKMAMKGVEVYGRPLTFISAYSAAEGYDLLQNNPDTCLILLDVVMETHDAGLCLVDRIRNELRNQHVQIILRTGQAGYAPEEQVIIRYEINAYKTKSELTRNKLFTSIATAIRSFQQLQSIEESRQGLRNIIHASASMLQERSVIDFSRGVLKQIEALFELSSRSLFCVSQKPLRGPYAIQSGNGGYIVVAADSQYQQYIGTDLRQLEGRLPIAGFVAEALEKKMHCYREGNTALYLSTPSGWEGVIVSEDSVSFEDADQELLQLFCMNIALGLENAKFFSYLNTAAYEDQVSGLLNRLGLIDQISRRMLTDGQSVRWSVFVLDLDYFHHIVESLGYEFGNQLLKKTGEMLSSYFEQAVAIARLHADVFAVCLKDTHLGPHDVALRSSKPVWVDGQSIRISMTAGEASTDSGKDAIAPELLLRQAEIALKVAKEQKRGSGEVFREQFEQESRNRMNLLNSLRIALEQKELYLMLQPKVDVHTSGVCGYEALIRWQHPVHGMIPPTAFIPTVEKSGLNYDLDLYVAERLCEILKAAPGMKAPVSLNISANSLNHDSFVGDFYQIFQRHQIAPSQIQIEVTENALIHSDQSIVRLRELRELGFVMVLDDFGAGFSSLSYLLRLPLQVIKIDRTFVSEISDNEHAYQLLKGIIHIVQGLHMETVIEGVETAAQLQRILPLGVDQIQGYIYYAPMSVPEAFALLNQAQTILSAPDTGISQ